MFFFKKSHVIIQKPQNAARTHGSLTSDKALEPAALCVGGGSEGPGWGASLGGDQVSRIPSGLQVTAQRRSPLGGMREWVAGCCVHSIQESLLV